MGGSSTTLSIVLKLVDEASAAMTGVGAKLKSVGDSMSSAGRTLTTDVTLPLAGIGYAATRAASDFQSSMMQLVTQAGLPADQLKNLTDQVQAFADSSAQQTPEILAQGLYHIVSLGVPAAHAMEVLKLASEGSAISGANLEDVANALGAAVASNIKGSGDYQQSMAILNATVGAGNMRMQDLATSLGNVLPQATTAGLSLKDVGAAMATMTDNGMPAADAATRLHMAIALMSAPTGQAKKALESIGMTQFQLADDMRNKGLLPALQDLHDKLVSSGKTADEQAAVLSAAFGGGRSAGAIELLLNNLDRVGQKYELIDKGVKNFGGDVQLQSETAAAKFGEAQAKMSDAMVKLGAALLPLIETVMPKLVAAVTAVVNWFTGLPKPVQNGILVFLGLLAVLGPLFVVIGSIITVFTTLMPIIVAVGGFIAGLGAPILILIGLFGFLAYYVITHWTAIKDGISVVWDAIKSVTKSTIDYIVGIFTSMFNTVMSIINRIISAASSVVSVVSRVGGAIMNPIGTAVNFATSVLHVNDAVITPSGQVIQTAAEDYLFATKNPGALAGGGGVVVNINGGYYMDQQASRQFADMIAKTIGQQLKLRSI